MLLLRNREWAFWLGRSCFLSLPIFQLNPFCESKRSCRLFGLSGYSGIPPPLSLSLSPHPSVQMEVWRLEVTDSVSLSRVFIWFVWWIITAFVSKDVTLAPHRSLGFCSSFRMKGRNRKKCGCRVNILQPTYKVFFFFLPKGNCWVSKAICSTNTSLKQLKPILVKAWMLSLHIAMMADKKKSYLSSAEPQTVGILTRHTKLPPTITVLEPVYPLNCITTCASPSTESF